MFYNGYGLLYPMNYYNIIIYYDRLFIAIKNQLEMIRIKDNTYYGSLHVGHLYLEGSPHCTQLIFSVDLN